MLSTGCKWASEWQNQVAWVAIPLETKTDHLPPLNTLPRQRPCRTTHQQSGSCSQIQDKRWHQLLNPNQPVQRYPYLHFPSFLSKPIFPKGLGTCCFLTLHESGWATDQKERKKKHLNGSHKTVLCNLVFFYGPSVLLSLAGFLDDPKSISQSSTAICEKHVTPVQFTMCCSFVGQQGSQNNGTHASTALSSSFTFSPPRCSTSLSRDKTAIPWLPGRTMLTVLWLPLGLKTRNENNGFVPSNISWEGNHAIRFAGF